MASTAKAFVHCCMQGVSQRARDWNRDFQAVFDADAFEPERADARRSMLLEMESELVAFTSRVARNVVESRMVEPPPPTPVERPPSQGGEHRCDGEADDVAPQPSSSSPPRGGGMTRSTRSDATVAPPQPDVPASSEASSSSYAACPDELAGFPGCFRVGNVLVRAWPNERQAKHYTHALRVVVLAHAPALHVPLTVLVSYCGISFTGQAIIPLGSRPVVVYRGDGKPDPAPVNGLVHSAVRAVTDTANCLVETVAPAGATAASAEHSTQHQPQHKLPGLEVQQGVDGRFYVIVATGLLPPVHTDVENGPIRRFESLTIVDVPAAPSADRSHATEMGVVLLFRAVAQITQLCDADRPPALVAAMRKVGLNLAFLGVAAALVPDEDSLPVEQRAAALGVICVEILARGVKSLLYAELTTQFQARRIEPLHVPVGNALELITTIDERRARKRLMPVITRKFFANKRLSSSSPVYAALLSTRMAKRKLILRRVCELAGLQLNATAVQEHSISMAHPDPMGAASPTGTDDSTSNSLATSVTNAITGGLVRMNVVSGRVSILPSRTGAHSDEGALKGIVCPPRLFGFGLPRVVEMQLAGGVFGEALANANLVLADRKQRYGRATVPYACSAMMVAAAQILNGRVDGGITLFHEALLSLHRAAREKECVGGNAGVTIFVTQRCVTLGNILLFLSRPGLAFVQFRKAAELVTDIAERQPAQAPHLGLLFASIVVGALQCVHATRASGQGRTRSPQATTRTGSDDRSSDGAATSNGGSRQSSMRADPSAGAALQLSGSSPGGSRMDFAKSTGSPNGSRRHLPNSRATTPALQSDNPLSKTQSGSPTGPGGSGSMSPRSQPTLAPWLVDLARLMTRVVAPDDGVYRVAMQVGEALMAEGHVTDASELLSAAVTIAVAAFGHVSEEHAAALAAAALALSKVNFDQHAGTCHEMLSTHVEITQTIFGDVSSEHAGALNNLGTLDMLRGRYTDAAGAFYDSLRVYSELGVPESDGGHGVARRNAAVLQARMMVRAARNIQLWYRRWRKARAQRRGDEKKRGDGDAGAADRNREVSTRTHPRASSPPVHQWSDSACDDEPTTAKKPAADPPRPESRRHDQQSDDRGGKALPFDAAASLSGNAGASSSPSNAREGRAGGPAKSPTAEANTADDDGTKHDASASPMGRSSATAPPAASPRPAEPNETAARSPKGGNGPHESGKPPQQAGAAPDPPQSKSPAAKDSKTKPTEDPSSTSHSPKAAGSPSKSPPAAAFAGGKSTAVRGKSGNAAGSPKVLGSTSTPASPRSKATKASPSSPRSTATANKQPAPQRTLTGLMTVPAARELLARAGRGYAARVTVGAIAVEAKREADRRQQEAEAAARRRELAAQRAALVAQTLARAWCSRLVLLRHAVVPLKRFVVGWRARAAMANAARARAQQRIRAATGKLVAAESQAREALLNAERKESKANFDQLMTIRRLQRNERARRMERQELVRTIQTKKANLEDDERGLRHAIENEATFIAAQLQRAIREKLRASQQRQQQQRQQKEKKGDEPADKATTSGAPAGLPPLAGGAAGAPMPRHGPSSSTQAASQPRRGGSNNSSRLGGSARSVRSGTADSSEGNKPLSLAELDGAKSESTSQTAAVERFQGFVLDDRMAALLADEGHARALQQQLTRQLLAIDDAVDAVRTQRDAVQAAIVEGADDDDEDDAAADTGRASPAPQRRALSIIAPKPPAHGPPQGPSRSLALSSGSAATSRPSPRRAKSEGTVALTARRSSRPLLPHVSQPTGGTASVSAASAAAARRQSAAADALKRLNQSSQGRASFRGPLPEVFGGSASSPTGGADWSQTARDTHSRDMTTYLRPARRSVLGL